MEADTLSSALGVKVAKPERSVSVDGDVVGPTILGRSGEHGEGHCAVDQTEGAMDDGPEAGRVVFSWALPSGVGHSGQPCLGGFPRVLCSHELRLSATAPRCQ